MKKVLANRVNSITGFINDNNVSLHAASAAFFMVLSLFPLLILVCSVLPYTGISQDDLFLYLGDVVPSYILELTRSMFDEYANSKAAIISVTALLAIWASGNGAMALRRGIAEIYNIKINDNFAIARLKSSLYTVFFILVVFFFMFVLVSGTAINKFLLNRVPDFSVIFNLLIRLRFLFVWIILVLIFIILYALMPVNSRNIFKLMPGAIVASIGWNILSFGFSLYVTMFGNISIYGNFVTVIFALLWLYWSMYILLIGAAINYFHNSSMNEAIEK